MALLTFPNRVPRVCAQWLRIPLHTCRFYSNATTHKSHAIEPRIDFGKIAANIDAIANNMKQRRYEPINVSHYKKLHQSRLDLYKQLVELKTVRNELSLAAKNKHNASKDERNDLICRGKAVKNEIKACENAYKNAENELLTLALTIPNDSHPNVPVGGENQARLLKTVGTPIPKTTEDGFERQDHVAIARRLNLIDFEQAALVSGSSFYYLQGMGAFLETALIQYAMSKAHECGFLAVLTPDIVRTHIAYGCGFQPRQNESSQIYDVATRTQQGELCLAGTAEIPLAGKFACQLLNEADMPQRLVGFGHAFRVEAGGRGVETKGLYRVHQFSKVELFAVTTPAQSEATLEEFRQLQEDIFTELGLTFRVLDMPTEELGASAYRKYDIEAWMPGRQKWGEISSTSNCTDYQSRRLSIRYRPTHHTGHNTHFCHTLNGTAIAVPRVIIAILETFQKSDGSVTIPSVLRPWLPGQPHALR